MSISKLLYKAFGIKSVILKCFNVIDNIAIFQCVLKKKLRKCAKCHSRSVQIKDTKVRRLRMIPLGSLKCFLEITVHKFKCKDCGASRWAKLPFAVGKLPMTQAFVSYILSLLKIGTLQGVGLLLGLQWKTVKNIHKSHLKDHPKRISYKKLRYLSVDEFSIKKGHTYMTVFTDICTGQIIYAVAGRKVEDIKPFLMRLAKKASNLEAIAMDMSTSYISAVKTHLPHVDIVFDRFHITKILNEALDKLRRQEKQKCLQAGEEVTKGDRFLLLKNFDTLTTEESSKLDQLFKINEPIAKMHTMKEQFREFWIKKTKKEAAHFLLHWIYEAVYSKIQPLVGAGLTLLRHYEGLLTYFDHHIDNGMAEGLNNKIKVLKRRAYGYRDLEYFELLLYHLHEKTTELVG